MWRTFKLSIPTYLHTECIDLELVTRRFSTHPLLQPWSLNIFLEAWYCQSVKYTELPSSYSVFNPLGLTNNNLQQTDWFVLTAVGIVESCVAFSSPEPCSVNPSLRHAALTNRAALGRKAMSRKNKFFLYSSVFSYRIHQISCTLILVQYEEVKFIRRTHSTYLGN